MKTFQIIRYLLLLALISPHQVFGAPLPPPPPPSSAPLPSDKTDESRPLALGVDPIVVGSQAQHRVVTVFVQVLLGGFVGVGAALMGAFLPALSCSSDSNDCNERIDIALRLGWVVGTVPTVWVLGEFMGWDGSFLATLVGGFLGAFIPPYGDFENLPALAVLSLAGSVVGFHIMANPKPLAPQAKSMIMSDNPNLGFARTTILPILSLDF